MVPIQKAAYTIIPTLGHIRKGGGGGQAEDQGLVVPQFAEAAIVCSCRLAGYTTQEGTLMLTVDSGGTYDPMQLPHLQNMPPLAWHADGGGGCGTGCMGTTLLSAEKRDNETMTNVHAYHTHFEPGCELWMDFGITVILMINHSSRNCDHLLSWGRIRKRASSSP